MPVRFAKTGATNIQIGGIYQANSLLGRFLVGDTYFLSHFDNANPGAVLLRTGGSAAVTRRECHP